jgi:hypothetical protein
MRAYLRFRGGDGASTVEECDVFESSILSIVSEGDGRIVSRSRGIETEWKDAWSRRNSARLQNRSCWAAGIDGRERG